MEKHYALTISHKDGRVLHGYCTTRQGIPPHGYGEFVAMRNGWQPSDFIVHVEELPTAIEAEKKCYANKSHYTEWRDRRRTYAAYDAARGYDLDDEGNSFHDYD